MARRHARRAATALALACGTAWLTAACGLSGGAQAPVASRARPDAAAAAARSGPSGRASLQARGTGGSGAANPTASAVTTSAAGAAPPPPAPLRGKVVVVDPGHNGANYRHVAQINRRVGIGNGTKACDTTGTETNAGYSEAAFTLDVATRLAALLRADGATVVLTRSDNAGVGPCITERAAIGNRAHADAAISIHGDGAAARGHGFHVIVPSGIGPNDAIVPPSRRLGVDVRDAFRHGTDEPLSTYTGTTTGGIVARSDLGGLNLSTVPKVFIECGNMRNAGDARWMSSAAGRQRAAAALAAGITGFLTTP